MPKERKKRLTGSRLRFVGMIAWVASGRPTPSASVKRPVNRCSPVPRNAFSVSVSSVPISFPWSTCSTITRSAHGSSAPVGIDIAASAAAPVKVSMIFFMRHASL